MGLKTKYCDVFGMTTDKQFVNTHWDLIRKRGAMDKQLEVSKKFKDILCHLCIDYWQAEPHFQHQNFAEHHYQDIKEKLNYLLNSSGTPTATWLLCMECICLGWRTPFKRLKGQTRDISMIL